MLRMYEWEPMDVVSREIGLARSKAEGLPFSLEKEVAERLIVAISSAAGLKTMIFESEEVFEGILDDIARGVYVRLGLVRVIEDPLEWALRNKV